MSAGNQILTAQGFGPSVFPFSQTILASGNYWIEEIDFLFTYWASSAAATQICVFELNTGGSLLFWVQEFLLTTGALANVPMNIPIISRPRIFLPRSTSVVFSITNVTNPPISAVQCSINLYGRTLP